LSLPEPPKVTIAESEPKLTLPVQTPPAPQPRNGPQFEDVTSATGQGGGGLPAGLPDGLRGALGGPGVNLDGTAPVASSGTQLPQLLSDPQGVDFRPYLAQVLAAVRRYWLSILPRSGHRGYVSVQFAIERDGTVGKVAFAQSAGDPTLDRISIAAISGGAPFGPLPVQFRGTEIHVQMNFSYFQPRQ
jgi:TonB family protein